MWLPTTGERPVRAGLNRRPLLPRAHVKLATASLIGRLEIPRLHPSAIVIEGIDKTSLRRADGHMPGTAMPGQSGNAGVPGHRDTFFRRLKDLRARDQVRVATSNGDFQYEVESLIIVEPDDVAVLQRSRENMLSS